MFFIYALYNSEREIIYVGQTQDLERRLARHNHLLPTKATSYTKKLSGKWEVVYYEPAASRAAARVREKQLKSARGRSFVWDIIRKSNIND